MGIHREQKRGLRSGFTVLEAAITVAIVGLVASYTFMATRSGRSTFENTSANSELEGRMRRAIDRVAAELLTVIETELQPDPTGDFGSGDILFAQAVGFDGAGAAPIPGTPTRLLWEYDPGEGDDGVDNDGDGLVDEGVLVLVRNDGLANEVRIVLCRGVAERLEGEVLNGLDDNGNDVRDEAGFNVHRVGDVLFLRLTAQEATETGDVLMRTLQTSIRIRN